MTTKTGSYVHIGSVGGSIQNSNISAGDIVSSPINATTAEDAKALLLEVRTALKDLAPRISAELDPIFPAAAHLGAASAEMLDNAISQIGATAEQPALKAAHSGLEQAKSMLDMLLKGTVAIPTAVASASGNVSGLVRHLTELSAKLGSGIQWVSQLIL